MIALTGMAAMAALPGVALAKDAGKKICDVGDDRIQELSGLATDGTDGYFAIVDGADGQNVLNIYGLDGKCQHAETGVSVSSIDPLDPEDLAVDSSGNFWIADTGDNKGERDSVALHKVSPDGNTATTYRFTYPGGAKNNAEALLLQHDGTPIFATWEPGKTQLFSPGKDIESAASSPKPMKKVGEFKIKATKTKGGPKDVGGVPLGDAPSTIVTGGAVSPDGKKAVLRTYTDAYEWKVSGGDVAKTIGGKTKPAVTPLPKEPQGEAIAYTSDGKKFVTASEAKMASDQVTVETPPQLWNYTPAKAPTSDSGSAAKDDSSGSSKGILDSLLDTLGVNGILWAIAGIGLIGLIMVIVGIRAIVVSRRTRRAHSLKDSMEPADDDYDDRYDDRYDRRDDRYDPRDDRYDRYQDSGYAEPGYGRQDDGLGGGRLFEPAPARDDGEFDEWPHRRDDGGGGVYGGRSDGGYGGQSRGSTYGHDDDDYGGGTVYGGGGRRGGY